MENTVKKLEMKFKLLTVINRDFEAMLERTKKKRIIQRVKNLSKILEEIYDLKIKDIENKVAVEENQEGTDVWDQEMQNKTHVYEMIIGALEQQVGKLRQRSTKEQGLEDELITMQRDSKGMGS